MSFCVDFNVSVSIFIKIPLGLYQNYNEFIGVFGWNENFKTYKYFQLSVVFILSPKSFLVGSLVPVVMVLIGSVSLKRKDFLD